jgi:hypothetical protein
VSYDLDITEFCSVARVAFGGLIYEWNNLQTL